MVGQWAAGLPEEEAVVVFELVAVVEGECLAAGQVAVEVAA